MSISKCNFMEFLKEKILNVMQILFLLIIQLLKKIKSNDDIENLNLKGNSINCLFANKNSYSHLHKDSNVNQIS